MTGKPRKVHRWGKTWRMILGDDDGSLLIHTYPTLKPFFVWVVFVVMTPLFWADFFGWRKSLDDSICIRQTAQWRRIYMKRVKRAFRPAVSFCCGAAGLLAGQLYQATTGLFVWCVLKLIYGLWSWSEWSDRVGQVRTFAPPWTHQVWRVSRNNVSSRPWCEVGQLWCGFISA